MNPHGRLNFEIIPFQLSLESADSPPQDGPCGPLSPLSREGPYAPVSPFSPLRPLTPLSTLSPLGLIGPVSPFGPCAAESHRQQKLIFLPPAFSHLYMSPNWSIFSSFLQS